MIITQDHNVHLYYQPYPPTSDASHPTSLHRLFTTLSISLLSPTAAVQGQSEHVQSYDSTLGGRRICVNAAIGLGYNGEFHTHLTCHDTDTELVEGRLVDSCCDALNFNAKPVQRKQHTYVLRYDRSFARRQY
jgi:hypothetical protein